MKPKFFCTKCMRFLNRLQVTRQDDMTLQPIFFCKWCGESVIQLKKVKKAIMGDYIDYIIDNNKEEDFI